jgi:hypothetical protein
MAAGGWSGNLAPVSLYQQIPFQVLCSVLNRLLSPIFYHPGHHQHTEQFLTLSPEGFK